jgi:hypothetical protein
VASDLAPPFFGGVVGPGARLKKHSDSLLE